MKRSAIFRVQDREGRGPFRPGLTSHWMDHDFAPGMEPLPTWMEEFGWDAISRLASPSEFFGSAVRRVEDIGRWFSPTERTRLAELGYRIVALGDARVLAESPNQLIFARSRPLAVGATVVRWT